MNTQWFLFGVWVTGVCIVIICIVTQFWDQRRR